MRKLYSLVFNISVFCWLTRPSALTSCKAIAHIGPRHHFQYFPLIFLPYYSTSMLEWKQPNKCKQTKPNKQDLMQTSIIAKLCYYYGPACFVRLTCNNQYNASTELSSPTSYKCIELSWATPSSTRRKLLQNVSLKVAKSVVSYSICFRQNNSDYNADRQGTGRQTGRQLILLAKTVFCGSCFDDLQYKLKKE